MSQVNLPIQVQQNIHLATAKQLLSLEASFLNGMRVAICLTNWQHTSAACEPEAREESYETNTEYYASWFCLCSLFRPNMVFPK